MSAQTTASCHTLLLLPFINSLMDAVSGIERLENVLRPKTYSRDFYCIAIGTRMALLNFQSKRMKQFIMFGEALSFTKGRKGVSDVYCELIHSSPSCIRLRHTDRDSNWHWCTRYISTQRSHHYSHYWSAKLVIRRSVALRCACKPHRKRLFNWSNVGCIEHQVGSCTGQLVYRSCFNELA